MSKYQTMLKTNPKLATKLKLKWSSYIPHQPTQYQHAFLLLPQREVFYGGACGGGKSDALLMAALQYIDVPNYSAILFRKTYADLRLSGALISRSMDWLSGTDAKWNNQQHEWTFPSGATLAFGNLDHELRKYRYQGAEFQFIGFDELTQFFEDEYLYLFSRLRRLKDTRVPLRMRAASNPGGIGHLWVKERFQIRENPAHPGKFRGMLPDRPFVPAFLSDNPFLEQEDYTESLQNLDPVTREQLLAGDWSVVADGRFRSAWFRTFSDRYDHWTLGPRGTGQVVHKSKCTYISICDPAASAREGPGDPNIWKKMPSFTVIGTFAITPQHDLLLVDIRRFRKEIPDIFAELHKVYREWHPEFVGIESSGLGIGVFQGASRQGLPVKKLKPYSGDKLVRATDACNRAEEGKIYLPEEAPWLDDFKAEIFTWTGHPQSQDDQVDVLAYAAKEVSNLASETGSSRVRYPTRIADLPSTLIDPFSSSNPNEMDIR